MKYLVVAGYESALDFTFLILGYSFFFSLIFVFLQSIKFDETEFLLFLGFRT